MAKPTKKAVRKPVPQTVFNLLGGNTNIIAAANESLHNLRARRKNQPTGLRTLNEIRRNGIPIKHFWLQYLLGLAYLPSRCALEIMGPEGIGKTTFAFTLMGDAVRNNVPCQYQETEAKPMLLEQIKRCLSTNRAEADMMVEKAIAFEETREITQAIKILEEWAMDMRGMGIMNKEARLPSENPIMGVIDTWSKLMTKAQALGYMDYADYKSAANMKDLKDVGEGSNLEHAKAAHWWCRRLPYLLDSMNMLIVWISHVNTKIDMGGGASYIPASHVALNNKTKIGGNAFNQTAAIQIILANGQAYKDSNNEYIGRTIQARVDKNSFGPRSRVIEYQLIEKYHGDTETYQDPVLQFDEGMAKFFADKKILQTTADKKRYTCETLGCIAATPAEFSTALHARPDLLAKLAVDLNIYGYTDPVTEASQPDEKTDSSPRA